MNLYRLAHQSANAAFEKLGMRLIKYPPDPLNCRMRQIERNQIDLVLDVGANEGQHAQMLRRAGYDGELISYEPQPRAYAALSHHLANDPKWTAHNCAVGAEEGRLTLNIAENSVASSILPIGQPSLDAAPECRYTSSVEVPVIALEETLRVHRQRAIMLKIDVQGFEPQVLQGCGELLEKVTVLDVEMALAPIYEGQALFDEVDSAIRARGFRRVGLDHAFWNRATGELLALDGIYARVNGD